jgi:uncharacterized repeat protein (TIGR02543 family)
LTVATLLEADQMNDKPYQVNLKTLLDDDNSISSTLNAQTYGNKNLSIDLNSSISAGYSFVQYIVNGKFYSNIEQNFRVTSNLEIVAVLKPAGKNVAVFLDTNGRLLGYDYVIGTGVPVPPNVSTVSKPGYQVDSELPWGVVISEISGDQIYVLNYVKTNSSQITVGVTGGTGAGSYGYNDIVTITASSPDFGYWQDNNGQIVSYQAEYSFTAITNRSFTAVDEVTTPIPLVSLVDVTGIRESYNSYYGQYELPAGFELVEAGFLFSSTYVYYLTLEVPNVEIKRSTLYTSSTNEFLRSAPVDDARLVRAYIVVQEGENAPVTYYSDVHTPIQNKGLMIWEVYSAGGNTGATYKRDFIVLYNGSNTAIDLAGYTIQYGSAIGDFSVKSTLNGIINAKSYYTVADTQSGSNGAELPFLINQSSGLSFGGTDGKVLLAYNNQASNKTTLSNVIDLIGYGNSADTFESVRTVDLSSSTSAKRNSTTDTNDNSTDFTVSALNVSYLPALETFDVAFNSNGGSAVSTITDVVSGATITLPTNPTKEGYAFIGWYSDLELTIEFTNSTPVTSDITLYAKWDALEQYTVSFNTMGGSPATIDSELVYENEIIPEPEDPTREGYNFAGWYTSNDDGVTLLEQWIFQTGNPSSNMTLYAKWSEGVVEQVLRQSDFGETNSSNTNYSNVFIWAIEHGLLDPNPNSNSNWIYVGGNFNNSSWDYMKFGKASVAAREGDLNTTTTTNNTAVDASDPNNYVATQFTLINITNISINVLAVRAATTIYLQTSADGINWTNTANQVISTTISSSSDITFSNLNIEAATYYRFVFVNANFISTNGWLLTLKTITFNGYPG